MLIVSWMDFTVFLLRCYFYVYKASKNVSILSPNFETVKISMFKMFIFPDSRDTYTFFDRKWQDHDFFVIIIQLVHFHSLPIIYSTFDCQGLTFHFCILLVHVGLPKTDFLFLYVHFSFQRNGFPFLY